MPPPAFNPANTPVWHPSIVADLAELLTHPDVQWSDIEDLVSGLPQESGYVRLLRATQTGRSLPQFFFGQSPSTIFTLSEDARRLLLDLIWPYALLLDNKLTPLEQIVQMRQVGIDAEHFCKGIQRSYPIYAEAAAAALQAWEDHSRLLRGSERAPEASNQLLRSASEAEADTDTLLQASEPAEIAPEPPKRGLLHRLLRKP